MVAFKDVLINHLIHKSFTESKIKYMVDKMGASACGVAFQIYSHLLKPNTFMRVCVDSACFGLAIGFNISPMQLQFQKPTCFVTQWLTLMELNDTRLCTWVYVDRFSEKPKLYVENSKSTQLSLLDENVISSDKVGIAKVVIEECSPLEVFKIINIEGTFIL